MNRFLIALFLVIDCFNSFSQSFKRINSIEGFTSKVIYDITFDKNDMLWIATYNDGLYRYDGKNLDNYIDTSDFNSYHSRKILEDNGEFLVGTSSDLFVISDNKLKKSNLFENKQQVTDIVKIGKADYLIATTVDLCRLKNSVIKRFDFDHGNKSSTRIISKILFDKLKNTYYFGTRSGLFKINRDLSGTIKLNFEKLTNFRVYDGKFINDTLYLATSEGLLLIKDEKIINIYNDSTFDKKVIYFVFQPKNKSFLWIFQRGKMYKFQNGVILEEYGVEDGFTDFEVSKVIEDKENNLVIATKGGGLFYFIEDYIYNYNVGNVASIFKYNDSIVYYLTNDQIAILNIKTRVTESVLDFKKLNIVGVKDFVVDRTGLIWVYLESNFLKVYRNSKVIKEINFNKIHPQGVLNKMFLSSKNELWLAFNNGQAIVHVENYKAENVIFKTKSSKSKYYTSDFKEIGKDFYILMGPEVLKQVGDSFDFKPINKEKLYVNSFEQDYRNNLWVKSNENFFIVKNNEFIPLQKKLDFSAFNIVSTDINKDFLIAYAEGYIYLFDLKEYYSSGNLKVYKFNIQSNFNTNLITTPKNFNDNNGNLYFGTENGIVKFNITEALEKDKNVKINLSNILLNYEKVNWKDLNYESKNNIPISPEFKYYHNNFTFQISNLNFFNSENTLFQYKLIGLDTNYTKPTLIDQINYSNLSYGNYEFIVKSFRAGFENRFDIIHYKFVILPVFYQTLWFKFLIFGFIFSCILLFFRYRTIQIKRKNAELVILVDEKTKLLSEKINEVTELFNQIKNKNLTINESIEYAKYIQDSILKLSMPTLINPKIVISEVIYLPKDIIGGDFYMIFNHNNLNYIITADCTGHGVPGALLTVLSKSLLNQIILYDNVSEPNMILEKLNELLWTTFANNSGTETSADSLSISILVLDFNRDSLVCSNSQMPFFLKSGNEIIEIKTHSTSLNINPTNAKYNSLEFKISQFDSILLYSDGIIDQPGGVNSKKLFTSGLKNWLVNESGMDYYSKNLKFFKNNHKQRDDIMLINIKLENT